MTRIEIMNEIRRYMDDKGITVYRLAKLSGLQETTVRRAINGDNAPSIDLVVSMLEGLGLELTIEEKDNR